MSKSEIIKLADLLQCITCINNKDILTKLYNIEQKKEVFDHNDSHSLTGSSEIMRELKSIGPTEKRKTTKVKPISSKDPIPVTIISTKPRKYRGPKYKGKKNPDA